MGSWSPLSKSIWDTKGESSTKTTNPNPRRFTIVDYHQSTDNLVLKIKYPDATNYEGNKILVYKGYTIEQIKENDIIDPHFSERGLAPFARFEPTEDGWKQAIHLAEIL